MACSWDGHECQEELMISFWFLLGRGPWNRAFRRKDVMLLMHFEVNWRSCQCTLKKNCQPVRLMHVTLDNTRSQDILKGPTTKNAGRNQLWRKVVHLFTMS